MNPLTQRLIQLFEERLAWEKSPTTTRRTRNGWAAYKGSIRITRYFFTEDGAVNAGIDWDNSDVKVQFVEE